MRNNKDNSAKPNSNDSNIMKRPLTLDLNKKIVNNIQGPPILSTPDVNKFKLESPELESFILNTDALQTPTPSGIFPPSAVSILNLITFRMPLTFYILTLRSQWSKKITLKVLRML
jgi:hypothetical protein